MDAHLEEDLPRLCEQWRVLSLHEARAIEAGQWSGVAALHLEKSRLQRAMSGADACRGQPSRRLLDELVSLERRNLAALAARRAALEQQQRELDRTSRNLGQVRRAYTQGAAAVWQSYS